MKIAAIICALTLTTIPHPGSEAHVLLMAPDQLAPHALPLGAEVCVACQLSGVGIWGVGREFYVMN